MAGENDLPAFASWLQKQLELRGSSRTKLAAAIDSSPQTVSAWYNEGRQPSTALCQRIATFLNEDVLVVLVEAGHLAANEEDRDYDPGLPAWLTSKLVRLDEYELRIISDTAQTLFDLRELREQPSERPGS